MAIISVTLRRMARPLIVAALVAALALAGCGGRGAHNAAGSSSAAQQTTATSGGAANTQVQSDDQQAQQAIQALDSNENDAAINGSGQETETQP